MTDRIDRIYRRLGKAVQRARRRRGLSQEDLGARCGLKRTSVVNMEAGRQRIPLHRIGDLARALRVPPRALIRNVWTP